MAIFVVDLVRLTLASVKVLTADPDRAVAEVEDARDEGVRHSVPLPPDW